MRSSARCSSSFQADATASQRLFGASGIIAVSLIGGFASSATAAATLASNGRLTPEEAASRGLLALASILFSGVIAGIGLAAAFGVMKEF